MFIDRGLSYEGTLFLLLLLSGKVVVDALHIVTQAIPRELVVVSCQSICVVDWWQVRAYYTFT